MMETVDVVMGVVPVVLVVAFIMLVVRMMTNERTGIVDRMKQAVGGAVMLLVALLVIFAFMGGGGGDGPGPGPEPEPDPTYTVYFHVATDSEGYGTVSIASLSSVPEGTEVTVAQTLTVGSAGQCEAAPATDTTPYIYEFAGWTGADDSDTPAPTEIIADTHYYAHFEQGTMASSLFTYSVSDGKATVTGWAVTPPEDGYDLVFPETDGDGHPVTGIAAVQGADPSPWTGAASVEGPSIEEIGDKAFTHCTLLTSVSLPAAASTGTSSFSTCTALESLALPSAESIGINTFQYCSALTSVSLPAATSIGRNAFFNCINLPAISLPAATSIEESAFKNNSSLSSVSLPAATSIGNLVFYDCTSLSSVSMPAVESIGSSAFDSCRAVTSVTFGPLTGTLDANAFPHWAFYDTDGTTVLSKTAANLGNSTFQGVYDALVKVDPNRGLTAEMQQRVLELSAENSLKASMLEEIDPELADVDGYEVARMTVEGIRSLTAEDVESMKAEIERRRALDDEEPPGGE